jgi:hypothetical protein
MQLPSYRFITTFFLKSNTQQLHKHIFGDAVWHEVSYNVPAHIQVLMSEPTTTLEFRFLDPVQALMRLLTRGPLSSAPENLSLFPCEHASHEDYCDGEKMKRIYNALPAGTAALTSILFFDSINRDTKGFSKGDGIIIVGAFFNKHARESSLAIVSLGAFPPINIAKTNAKLKAAADLTKAARSFFHASIYQSYVDFNATNGVMCELQNGNVLHMYKAIILAIYTDQPAATKCSDTGSACPQCYTAQHIMGIPPRVRGSALVLRTPNGMEARRTALSLRTGT